MTVINVPGNRLIKSNRWPYRVLFYRRSHPVWLLFAKQKHGTVYLVTFMMNLGLKNFIWTSFTLHPDVIPALCLLRWTKNF